MLTKVEVTTAQGATLALPLGDISGGFVVKDIDGLDPVKATLVSSSFANMDGEQYQSSRRESRNILIKLGLEPDYSTGTVRQLRKLLYSFLMPKAKVRLRFFVTGEDPVDIDAIVESFDSPSFTQTPEATISLVAHQPDFFVPTPVLLSGATSSDTTEFLINYEGTVETGFLLTLNVDRPMSEFTIYHRPADDTLRSLEFVAPLAADDVLLLSTITGAKGVILTNAEGENSVLYGVSPYSNWINLYPGPNYIRVYTEGAPVPFTIGYTTKIGGL